MPTATKPKTYYIEKLWSYTEEKYISKYFCSHCHTSHGAGTPGRKKAVACCPPCGSCGSVYCQPHLSAAHGVGNPACGKPKCECDCCKKCGATPCICCKICGYSCSCCCLCNKVCPQCGKKKVLKGDGCTNCDFVIYPDIGVAPEWPRSTMNVAKKKGLSPYIPLPQIAANYYLLENLANVQHDIEAKNLLYEMGERYAPEFATYLDIAIGGEARYISHEKYSGSDIYLLTEYCSCPEFPPHPSDPHGASERSVAWDEWTKWKDPLERAEWATALFYHGSKDLTFTKYAACTAGRNPWNGGGIGGPKWGDIAHTLLMYLEKKIPNHLFLDRVWNLQHNGGICLNKVYVTSHTPEMSYVLQAHGKDDYKKLLSYASANVVELWSDVSDNSMFQAITQYQREDYLAFDSTRSHSEQESGRLERASVVLDQHNLPNTKYWQRWLRGGD